jgi:N-acylneuraminate cytidylyltransferase
MPNIAIIPARGGSKRIPRKNIRLFCGFPIIKYSIEAALASDCFDEVMVSTDDEEIAAIARKYGAKVPFMRSIKTADDFASTDDVLKEVIGEYAKIGKEFDYVCCVYPTTPLLTSDKIKASLEKIKQTKAALLFAVVKYSYPVQRALRIRDDGTLAMISPDHLHSRSQDLEPIYHDAGQFYWYKYSHLVSAKPILEEGALPFEVDPMEVQDIDTEDDWEIAEIKFAFLKRHR